MVLDWFGESRGSGDSVADLIARRKYARAIEVLRAQFEVRAPDAKTRLQLADLLVLAGRQQEAIPILVSLADEFTVDGFVAKAVAILKRIEKLEPGRPDVEERMAFLVNRGHVAPPVRFSPPRRLEIGIEGEPVSTASAALAATEEPEIPAPPAPGEPLEVWQEPPAFAEADRAVEATPAPPETAEAPATEPVAEAAAPRPAVARRIRSILGRLLAARRGEAEVAEDTRPGEEARPDTPEPPPADLSGEAAAEAPPEGEVARREPGEPEAAEPPAPGLEEPEAPPVETPEAGEAPPDTLVAEAPPERPADAEVPRAEDAEAEPESVGDRLKGFFGRLWPGRQDEATAHEAEATGGEGGEEDAAEDEFDLSTEAEQAPEPPAAPPAAEAVPEPALAEEIPAAAAPSEPEAAPEPAEDEPMSEEAFQERLLDVIEDVLKDGARRGPKAPSRVDSLKLATSPLLGELDEEERLSLVHRLRLLTYEPGDVVISEGEQGGTLYLLTTGSVKVFVRNPASRNVEVRVLREGDFFGEVAILSGRPRTATITAASDCELLELDRSTLDDLGRAHPGIVDTLEAHYIERTQSPDNAAVRAAAVPDAETQHRAAEVLRAHFGDRAWDPRMRLKLADVLLKAGKQQDALPILVDLADTMARQGHPEKAIAILKKIERIEGRHTEEINLAPLGREAPAPAPPPPEPARRTPQRTSEYFGGWLVELVKDTLRPAGASSPRLPAALASSAGLLLSPLFEDFSDAEIQALIDGLRLLAYEAGDILISEGEPGNSVFVVTSGAVKVFVRSPSGHNAEVGELREGEFFGEISTLSGRPRSATVTATTRTEVLELDKPTLDAICAAHPRVRDVLEEVYIQRASHPYAAMVRGVTPQTG